MLQNPSGAEARILSAGRPREIAERLQTLVTGDDVNPVPRFDAADERQDFVDREIERMKHQAEEFVIDEWKESKGAVARPFHNQRVASVRDARFDEPRPLAERANLEPGMLEREAVAIPRPCDCLLAVMEDVDVAGQPVRCEDDAERDAAGHITLAAAAPLVR